MIFWHIDIKSFGESEFGSWTLLGTILWVTDSNLKVIRPKIGEMTLTFFSDWTFCEIQTVWLGLTLRYRSWSNYREFSSRIPRILNYRPISTDENTTQDAGVGARSGLVSSWLASRDNLIEEVRASKRGRPLFNSLSRYRADQTLTEKVCVCLDSFGM